MKTWISTSLAAALAATVALGAPAATAAERDACGGSHSGMHGMKHRMSPEHLTERADERIAKLQQALAIRPEQRAAWDEFGSVLRGNAQKAAEHMRAMHERERPKTAIERMQRIEAFGEERIEAMRDIRKAAEALYANLDAAQKKTFDEQFHAFEPGRMGGRGRHHGHEHGMGHGPASDV